ncbi:hypothetical protein JG688_00005364, partial [Phytophthora aleatoria]
MASDEEGKLKLLHPRPPPTVKKCPRSIAQLPQPTKSVLAQPRHYSQLLQLPTSEKIPTTTKHALHPMSDIGRLGSMTVILASSGAGKSTSTYYLRLIFFSTALFQRQARQQITISFQLRKVFYKQRPRSFFRTTSYAIAESVVHIPANMTVSFVLGTFFYFMSGLTRTFEKYIVFCLELLAFQHAISTYMTILGCSILQYYSEERQLLQKVTAHVEPGRMVALVVTVMDAIAVLRAVAAHACRSSSPYLIVDIILFGTLEYWLVGRSDNGGDFFSFIFVFYLPPASSHVNEKATSGSRNLMPSSYSPEALVSGQFGDIIAVTSGDNTTDVTVAQYIEETYAFRPNRKYNFMVDLVVIWAWCSYLSTSHSTEDSRSVDHPAERHTRRETSIYLPASTTPPTEFKMSLLQPEANDAGEEVPGVYRSLNFRSLQDPYSHRGGDTMTSRYSTLRADNLETMLNGGLERFYKKYNHLSSKINLQLPTPEVRFENLSFSVQVPASVAGHNTVGSHLASIFTPWQKVPMVTKRALHPMTGIIKPGSMTLILANPGAGKSTFLKAMAGKLQDNKQTEIGGEILYSGLKGEDIDLIKLVGLVDQMDNHIPTLTVRETFKFADMCVNGRPEDQPEEMRDIAALRTELFLQILGLENCADTVVGNALLRGVSGGERKRVTVGEVLVGGQSLFLCDEISTGLDSAATFDIIKALRTWCKTLGGSVIVALLQPTPEVVEQFDDILMVNEGHMVYHGPRTEILDYFDERGFSCPPRVDPADFLIEVTSGRGHGYSNGKVERKDLAVSSEDFNNLFCQSSIYKKTHQAISKGFNEHQFENPEDFQKAKSVANLARSKEKSEFGLAFVPSTMLLLNRQKLIWLRDPPLLWGKLFEALIVGLVLGMIYFNVSSTYYLRMIFFSIALFQRQAWQQITISFQLRGVFYKQRPRNFFRTMSYAIAETVVQIPVNLSVSFILGTFFYFMSGLTRTFEKYIVFFLVLVCFQHAIGAYMTMLSSLSPSITLGQALAGISVSFFLLFSGNIILADLIPNYWIWMYWFNPLAWALRSNMLSEFSSDRYTPAQSAKFLDSFSISQGTEYVWFGIGILVAYYLFFTTLNGLALHFIRYEKYKGVSVKAMTDNAPEEDNVYVEVRTPGSGDVVQTKARGGGLPFTPSNLCIKDLEYFVTLPSGEEKQLLRGITAHFEPGRMVALMGATGAGKTTLMDVIAGRKTGGRIVGDIIVNGEPKNPANFSRITAYCEQMDIHSEAASI